MMQGLLETAMFKNDYDDALMALAVWLRFSAARHLTWNRNFNVKPREISAAQVRDWQAHPTQHIGWGSCIYIHLHPMVESNFYLNRRQA